MQQRIQIIGTPGHVADANVEVEIWSSGRRLRNGGKIFAICLGISAAILFIPVVHLLLPLLVLAGLAGGIAKSMQRGIFKQGEVRCPQCGATVDLSGTLYKLPLYRACPDCAQQLFIDRAGN